MSHTVLDKCTKFGHDTGAITYHKASNIVTNRKGILCEGPQQIIQGNQKISVHLMIRMQKVTSNVRSVPRHSPDIY
jgi:hypothetical protein